MNKIVPFTRPIDVDSIPGVAWAIAQLIVVNGVGPDVVAAAVNAYIAATNADDDDADDDLPALH
jgi:hypothetical protein